MAIEKAHLSLQNALISARTAHAQLQQRLEKARTRDSVRQTAQAQKPRLPQLQLDLSLWDRRAGKQAVDFTVLHPFHKVCHN